MASLPSVEYKSTVTCVGGAAYVKGVLEVTSKCLVVAVELGDVDHRYVTTEVSVWEGSCASVTVCTLDWYEGLSMSELTGYCSESSGSAVPEDLLCDEALVVTVLRW